MATRRDGAPSTSDFLTDLLDLGEWVFLLITLGAVSIILGYASSSGAAVVIGVIIIILAIVFAAWVLLTRDKGGMSSYAPDPSAYQQGNAPDHSSDPAYLHSQPIRHQYTPPPAYEGPPATPPPPPYASGPPQQPGYLSYPDPWASQEPYSFGPSYSRPEPPSSRQPVRCPNCGGKVFFGRAFCPNCSAKIYEDSFETQLEKVR